MLEALVNLASTDALAADVLALSETFHCTPLEVFKTMTDAAIGHYASFGSSAPASPALSAAF